MTSNPPAGFPMHRDPRQTALDTLRGVELHPRERTPGQRLARAVPFRVNDHYEHLLLMRVEQPDAFTALPPNVHIALGLYEADKATHDDTHGSAA